MPPDETVPEEDDDDATQGDAVVAALDEVADAAAVTATESGEVARRARHLRRLRVRGLSWRDIATQEHPPLLVQLITGILERLARVGSRLRRAEAHALRTEGMSTQEVARLFGVSRQRVSRLLAEEEQLD